ncbi:hypothetical protein FO440_00200 [Mucilaginibacter corticis]|uniref:Uncharacterized protein n=1 Tax=Mucilaginibacter corticis TaxID=2597670 RepID=A0A556MS74_9SPHI|nr:hypothetical protein [Mucilaginibacter corticis]TSJ42648.1 hypothetical protein FO440_00200 [Mucilaginibacter corticis]
MKIFDLLQSGNSGPVCRDCVHFENDPAIIEKTYPGLAIMSSGYASVRDCDGICNFNDLYLSAHDSCPNFTARAGKADR